MTVYKFKGKNLQVRECLRANIAHDFVSNAVVYDVHQPLRHAGRRDNSAEQGEFNPHCGKIDVAGRNDEVDNIAEYYGRPQVARDSYEREEYRCYHERAIWFDLFQYALVDIFFGECRHVMLPPFRIANSEFHGKADSFRAIARGCPCRLFFRRRAL